MPITVYTYHDPYKLKENTNLWKEISSCPYFCVSQTLVNGLKSVYGSSFQIGRVTTVMNLTSALFSEWVSTSCAIKQHAAIDNVIANYHANIGLSDLELENVKKSFLFNRDEVFTSIRTMFELRINPDNIVDKYLTAEQQFIVSVYKYILEADKAELFLLNDSFKEEKINQAIFEAMKGAKEIANVQNDIEVTSMDTI